MTIANQEIAQIENSVKEAAQVAGLFVNPQIDKFRPAGPLARAANHLNADTPMLLSMIRGEDPDKSSDPHIRGLASMSTADRTNEMIRNWHAVRSLIAWNMPHLDKDQKLYYGVSDDPALQNTESTFGKMLRLATEAENAANADKIMATRIVPSFRPREPETGEDVSSGVIIVSNGARYLVEMNDIEKGEVFQPREVAGIAGDKMKAIWGSLSDALIPNAKMAVSGTFYTKSLRDDRAGPVLLTGVPVQTEATDREAIAASGAVNLYLAQHEWGGRPIDETVRLASYEPIVKQHVISAQAQNAFLQAASLGI